ncbi:hypothetical protein E4U47_004701 [Claviceps purpurea]|nr:hypothetical protein E4U10_001056 [Claviceps purpurea]KAG6268346.1 hypothetical protein E4U47_004701 [Claviceps purpurea]KAG6309392.1 hypothetical protein E4U44_006995 [Claviceps purpurea]
MCRTKETSAGATEEERRMRLDDTVSPNPGDHNVQATGAPRATTETARGEKRVANENDVVP